MSYISDIIDDTKDYVCSITPVEFELYCMKILKSYADEEGLKNFKIDHNVKVKTDDGTFQIDILASFTALGVELKMLCECKQYSSLVKRERVELLEGRLRDLGMHKGILLSPCGFQRGAIKYAKKHGIALIQVFDKSCVAISHSGGTHRKEENDPFLYMEKRMPPYRAICFSDESEIPIVVYPSKQIMLNIYKEASDLFGLPFPLVEVEGGKSEQEG